MFAVGLASPCLSPPLDRSLRTVHRWASQRLAQRGSQHTLAEGVAREQLGSSDPPEWLSCPSTVPQPELNNKNQLMCVKCRCQALTASGDWNLREGPRIWVFYGASAPGSLWPPCLPWESLLVRFLGLCRWVGNRAGDPAPWLDLTTPHPLSDFQALHSG